MLFRTMLFILCLILSLDLRADVKPSNYQNVHHEQLPFGERIKFPSKFLNQAETFDVYLPKSFSTDSDTTQYPLIITMDGWALSQTVSGISSHLMNTAALPNSVVIALHTDVWSMLPSTYVHSTDNWPADPTSQLANAFKNNVHNAAEPFWQFLEKELLPFAEEHYRTNHFRTLVGMSPTAYMALHTMLEGPDLFNAYVLIAAIDILGLGYTKDKDFADEIIDAAKKGALNNKFLYVASAEFESRREPRHYDNAKKLDHGLSKHTDKLSFKVENIDNFGHYPVAIPAFTNALNLIFPRGDFQKFQAFDKAQGEIIPKIVKYYIGLSERYGVTINVPTDIARNPNSLRSIGYKLLKREDYIQAEQAFTLWVSISDKDPNAYFWLSRVLAAKGELEKAIINLEKAIYLSSELAQNNVDYFQTVLTQYKAQTDS